MNLSLLSGRIRKLFVHWIGDNQEALPILWLALLSLVRLLHQNLLILLQGIRLLRHCVIQHLLQ